MADDHYNDMKTDLLGEFKELIPEHLKEDY